MTKPFSLPVLYAKAMALTGRIQGINAYVEQDLDQDGGKMLQY